jgi:hypothetical protein
MNPKFSIIRFPNTVGRLRGPEMQRLMCQKCLKNKTHGFWMFDGETIREAIFICDECLKESKQIVRQPSGSRSVSSDGSL